MAGSLQDQLLKAGLADKQKATKIKQEKRKKAKIAKKHKLEQTSQAAESVQQAKLEKQEKDRQLNAQLKAQAELKALAAQIKQLISLNQQPINNGDLPINFTDDNKVKRIHVNERTKTHITKGKLAIAKYEDGYALIPVQVADKIAQRDESVIVYRADQIENQEEATNEEDDWYADYQIPDDLTW